MYEKIGNTMFWKRKDGYTYVYSKFGNRWVYTFKKFITN